MTVVLLTRQTLFRDELGAHLRGLRQGRGERLVDTARRAGVSPQYLSEIERGIKDPSSEMIAAVAGALDVEVGDLAVAVGERLKTGEPRRPAAPQAFALALAA
ncbi:helix-turn-helix transcriptional regulator [Tsukamurella sp. 8F]|uniref:helix-turn-helix domain-containing protein n=1 Tax=unclassified Tsukamurella TaxID=2633480 RepID=UPI0023B91298|nr:MULTISPECIES: helix-turn-helix transcriptional regulator [unclassified Tsukamurella]MDF0531351.1 helix-turn-helix transcriptional regulator [Tsukamurella sp. 8J]MDF0588557.1 helix-turn-helix transcriptional regulator [Tsukamurella sp. 8F]